MGVYVDITWSNGDHGQSITATSTGMIYGLDAYCQSTDTLQLTIYFRYDDAVCLFVQAISCNTTVSTINLVITQMYDQSTWL